MFWWRISGSLFLLVVVSSGLSAEDADPPKLTPAQRDVLRQLPKEWGLARGDIATQRDIVELTIELGPIGIEKMRPKVTAVFEDIVGRYGKAFQAQAKKLETATVDEVLAGDRDLRNMRRDAVDIGELEYKLATAAGEEDKTDFKEYLRGQEEAALRLLKLGPIWSQLDDEEIVAIQETNRQRKEAGLDELEVDLLLVKTGRDHSADMARLDFFSHTSPVEGKTNFTDRAALFGAVAHGENIFAGSTSGARAVDGWMNSPPHKENILRPGFKRIGIGRSGKHWTQLFGR